MGEVSDDYRDRRRCLRDDDLMTPYRSAVSYDVRISRLRNAVTNIPRTAA